MPFKERLPLVPGQGVFRNRQQGSADKILLRIGGVVALGIRKIVPTQYYYNPAEYEPLRFF
jgi:hypothetical protein